MSTFSMLFLVLWLIFMGALGGALWITWRHLRRGDLRFRRLYIVLLAVVIAAAVGFLFLALNETGVLTRRNAPFLALTLSCFAFASVIYYRYLAGKTSGVGPLFAYGSLMMVAMYSALTIVFDDYATLACLRVVWSFLIGISASFGMRKSRKIARTGRWQ